MKFNLEEASTHKSAKTHAGDVFRDYSNLDLWAPDRKLNGFPGLIVKHFYAKFGDPVLEISCGKQSDRHTKFDKRRLKPYPRVLSPVTAVGEGNKNKSKNIS